MAIVKSWHFAMVVMPAAAAAGGGEPHSPDPDCGGSMVTDRFAVTLSASFTANANSNQSRRAVPQIIFIVS
jgi:hypothetical protein